MNTHAENLLGVVLNTGWTIIQKLDKPNGETGGIFRFREKGG